MDVLVGGEAALGDYGKVFNVAHCDGVSGEIEGAVFGLGNGSGRGRRAEEGNSLRSFTILRHGNEGGT